MLVKLKNKWFAPTEVVDRDQLTKVSGRRFPAGVQEIPDIYKNVLPSSAVMMDKKPVEIKATDIPPSLRDLDEERAAADASVAAGERAEQTIKEIRQDRMAKARAAKKAKAEGK